MGIWKSTKWVWARIGDFLVAKELALLIAGPTVLVAILGPLAVRLITPMSFIDTAVTAAGFGVVAFFVARYFTRNLLPRERAMNIAWPSPLEDQGLSEFAKDLVGRKNKAALDAAFSRSEGIQIILGSGAPFDFVRDRLHHRTHLIRIGVRNPSASRRLTNCDLSIECISGRLAQRCPVPIKANFDLNPGKTEYIDFVEFDEAISGPPISEPPAIMAYFPINKISNGKSYLDDQPYDLTLKATAAESAPFSAGYRLWVENGVLRLEAGNAAAASGDIRMSSAELRSEAILNGWPANLGDVRWLTFVGLLRQAASDGVVTLWGRSKISSDITGAPLLEIPAAHWHEFELDGINFLSTYPGVVSRSYNVKHSGFFSNTDGTTGYTDLHATRAQALTWLPTLSVPS